MEFIELLPDNWAEYLAGGIGSLLTGGLGAFGTKKLIDKKQDDDIASLKSKLTKITKDSLMLKKVSDALQKKINVMDKSLDLLKKDVETNTAFDKEHRAQVAKEIAELKSFFRDELKEMKGGINMIIKNLLKND